MDKLKKMKFLLLIPISGAIIIMTYLNFKSNKTTYVKLKHWSLIVFLIGIIFWVTLFLVFAIISTIMKQFIIENDSLLIGAFVVAFTVGGYIANIPCLLYVNYLIKQSEKEKEINNDKSNYGDNIGQNVDKQK